MPAPVPSRDRSAAPLIGRERELATARQRVVDGAVRLLTLTGPPGVGKTRLALELASEIASAFESGAVIVDLSPVAQASQVADAIARGIGLETGARPAAEAVEAHLRERSLLLVLDNFEQVIDAAKLVAGLLTVAPGLKVVATSRAPLKLRWESLLPIPPLALPNAAHLSPDAVASSPAGQLFIERARAVSPSFTLTSTDAAAVAEICTHLDGLPLAIELAAARIRLFPPHALLRQLQLAERESPLRILAGDPDQPQRQQTLRRAIAWSYDLLRPEEQALFRRLSVFVGGCSLDAAESVGQASSLELVTALVDESLASIEHRAEGSPRVRMLETIRQFAREQLEASGEAEQVRARHAAFFVALAEQASKELVGPLQQTWFTRLEDERDNLHAAERWAAARGDADTIVRLAAALWPFWLARGDASQTRDGLGAILPLIDDAKPSPILARALHGTGLLAEKLGDYTTCRALLEAGLSVARQFDDRQTLGSVLDSLGRQAFIEGRYVESRDYLKESHAILLALRDRVGLARVLSHLGFLEYLEGNTERARALYEDGLELAREVEDRHRIAEFMDNLGNALELEGDLDNAARKFGDAVAMWRDLGQGHWLAMALNNLGRVQALRGELPQARRYLREALSLSRRMGNRRRMAYTLSAVATLCAAEGHPQRAAHLDSIAMAAIAEIGARPVAPRARSGPPEYGSVVQSVQPTMTLEQAVDDCLGWLGAPDRSGDSGGDGLTRREREVVALLARGFTNRQVAEALVVTEGTAENYVQRVLVKLGVNNRAQVAVWAVQHGLAVPK